MLKKIDRRISYFLVFDTETANSLDNPLMYDLGFAIVDKRGKVYARFSLQKNCQDTLKKLQKASVKLFHYLRQEKFCTMFAKNTMSKRVLLTMQNLIIAQPQQRKGILQNQSIVSSYLLGFHFGIL